MKELKKSNGDSLNKARHSTRRDLRGPDRRAIRREWREAQAIILHPALFERRTTEAA